MTHLQWRGRKAYFRYRLPPELRGIPKPKHWPKYLEELVSPNKNHCLKLELTKALGTADDRVAKRRAAEELVKAERLVTAALEFLKAGPKRSITEADIARMAAQFGADLMASDMDLRRKGLGLRLPRAADKLAIRKPRAEDNEPGLTEDDLALLQHAITQLDPVVKNAVARQRPTQFIKDAVSSALDQSGIDLLQGSGERRDVELAFLNEYAKVLRHYDARNRGEVVPTPNVLRSETAVPTLQMAFETWRTGSGARGEKLPAKGSVEEASHAIRRFIELHGNLFVTEITPQHARSFKEAIAKVPPRLPLKLQSLPLPQLIAQKNLPASCPAASTVNKKITLLTAVLHKAVLDHGLKMGWHNPFEGLKIAQARGAKGARASFNADDLQMLLSQSFMKGGTTSTDGGKGLAARWLPLLAMFTGARRRELAQLRLADVMTDDGVAYLRITDLDEDQSVKVAGSIRRVPIHPELIRCGFLQFAENRRGEAKISDWLFADLEMNRKGDRGDAWGRWFGRLLGKLGIDAKGTKVFHSFRHTFISRCREAEIPEELRFALTGHSDGGMVGRAYGGDESGFKHSLKRLHKEICKIRYPGVDLSHLYTS